MLILLKKVEHYKFTKKKTFFFWKVYMKMEKKIIKFDYIKIPKQKFHQDFIIKNVDIDKIVESNKVLFGKKGFKYFIG